MPTILFLLHCKLKDGQQWKTLYQHTHMHTCAEDTLHSVGTKAVPVLSNTAFFICVRRHLPLRQYRSPGFAFIAT